MLRMIQAAALWCCAAVAIAGLAAPAQAQGNTNCVSFTRQVSPQIYAPGGNVTVTVSFTETCTDIIAALGLVETIPPGWIYISSGGPTPPDTRPDVGDTGNLEFSWISTSFPFSFTYTIRAPQNETGDKPLSGTAEYRVGTGTAQFFGPVNTLLDDGITQCEDQPGCVSAVRSTGNGLYPPGAALQVSINLTENCTSDLQELSITEEIPAGWTFASASGAQAPTLQPDPGEAGPLVFSWTVPPSLPLSFTYTLAVPSNATGQQQLSGSVSWRTCETMLQSSIPATALLPSESPLEDCIAECGTSAPDADGDQLNDCVEECLGTDPDDPDTDRDGIPDGVELFAGLNPVDVLDGALDLDNDGDSNLREFLNQTGIDDADDPAPVYFLSPQGLDNPAGGNASTPWRSIPYALAELDNKAVGAARLLLAPGIYSGDITLRENTAIIGLEGCGEDSLGGCSAIVGAITGAEGALLRNVVVTAPENNPDAVLLSMDNIAMEVDNVIFLGTEALMNTGVRVTGERPGDGLIGACRFERLATGIDVRGCHPRIYGCTFLDHATAYIVFAEGVTTCGGSLGEANDPNTGWNRFVEGTGLSIINERPETIVMERNDWDTNNRNFIDARIDGAVDFEPFLAAGSALFSASFFATVTSRAGNGPVTTASVSLAPGGLNPVTQNLNGVYPFAVIPEGSYNVSVTAPGFQPELMPVFIDRGTVYSAIFVLEPLGGGEGEGEGDGGEEGEEGEGEGEPTPVPGCQCPRPGKAVPMAPDGGTMLVGLLSMAALVVPGFRRRGGCA
jgi:hypothetical protein